MSATWRRVVLLVMATYFLLPVFAAFEFATRDVGNTRSLASFRAIVAQPELLAALATSLRIAVGTIALSLLLMIPTVTWLHLRLPHLRRVVEGLSLVPLVIPAVVLAVGVLSAFSTILPQRVTTTTVILALEYVVLALPFTYRALDAGLAAIDLRTLVEAARGLGADWPTVLLRVVLPNIRTAVLGASFLILALVLGEFTMASLLLFTTLPTWIVQAGQEQAGVAVGLSVIALVFTWVLLLSLSLLAGRRRVARTQELA